MKCFWLKGSAFLGAVPGSALGAQTGLRPHCSSCFPTSPRMPSAWARLCPLPMVPAGLSPWNDSPQRTVSVAWPHQVCHQALEPELALKSHLHRRPCCWAQLCVCRAVPVTAVRLEEVLGLRHLTTGFTFCFLWWIPPRCSPTARCSHRCLWRWHLEWCAGNETGLT